MQRPEPESDHSSLDLNHYLVILFRVFSHKRIILISTAVGLIAAAAVHFLSVANYESRAKLLVRYVVERSAIDPVDSQADFRGSENQKVINAEVEILTSWDLAMEVAEAMNAQTSEGEKVYPGDVASGLDITASPSSNVIGVAFQHRDPNMAVPVLQELVKRYFDKHLEIHRSAGAFEFVTQQTDQVRTRLRQIEEELEELKSEAGIISIEESTTSLGERMAKLQMDLMTAETESAEQKARVRALEKMDAGTTPDAPDAPQNSPGEEEIEQYQTLVELLADFRKKKLTLLMEYTPEHRLVKINDRQITEAETRRAALAERFPSLVITASPDSPMDLIAEKAKLAATGIRAEILRTQIGTLKDEARNLGEIGTAITELERRKEAEVGKYLDLESTLNKARADEALDPSKMPNISTVQRPSGPFRVSSALVKKLVLLLSAGGLAVGIGLAFVIEQILDRRVKQPLDLTRMRLPLMMSIPYLSSNGHATVLQLSSGRDDDDEPGKEVSALAVQGTNGLTPSPWEAGHFVRPYSAAIRDRLSCYFELNNMTHKPKLVALTGFSEGAGTTTLAIGLASAFSEIGDGKVLLVDMNFGEAEAHPFFKGKPACQLAEALEADTDADSRFEPAGNNLYLATATTESDGTRQFVPKKLYELIPQFKASDFDYIIFDMPPLGQTSPTLAMAGFMDKVLLVVDGDKTSRDVLKRGHAELVAAKADVSCLFNKARSYIPSWLQDQI